MLGEQDKPNVYEQIKNKEGKQSNITQSRLKEICLLVCLVHKNGVTLCLSDSFIKHAINIVTYW